MDSATHKQCSRCKALKLRSEFYRKAKKSSDGLMFWCKQCGLETHRAWFAKNPQKHLARIAKWVKENPERVKRNAANFRDRHRLRIREEARKRELKSIRSLSDKYVRYVLWRSGLVNPSAEQVQAKRIQLLAYRTHSAFKLAAINAMVTS